MDLFLRADGLLRAKYTIKIDIEKIRTLAQKFEVDLQWYGNPDEKNTFDIRPVDLAGSMDIKRNFALCDMANSCIALKDGKLYPCHFAPNIYLFNKRFGVDIPVTSSDYVDIYQETNPNVILQKLSQPIPICRFCNLKYRSISWRVSKREMAEWL